MDVATQLGVEHRVYSPYHPQSTGRIEGLHNFLKACMSKHVSKSLEWDQVIPLACAAYNFLLNEHSKESPFLLMLDRDPIVPLNSLSPPTVKYLGINENILFLEALKNMYQLVADNLEQAKKKGLPKPLNMIENVVRVTLFYSRTTLPVWGVLGILETVKSYAFPERLKSRW